MNVCVFPFFLVQAGIPALASYLGLSAPESFTLCTSSRFGSLCLLLSTTRRSFSDDSLTMLCLMDKQYACKLFYCSVHVAESQ